MIYGTPIVKRLTDVTDRIGIRTLVLNQMWQPSSSTLTQAQIDDETPDQPVVPGGLLWIGQQTLPFGGCYKTSWTFEGINGDGKSVTFAVRGKSNDYGFDPGFSQLPISQHNLFFTQLLPNFGGTPDPSSDDVLWPPYLPSANTSTIGLPGDGSSNGQTPNPMFHHQDFFSMEGTYRYRYASLTPPTTYTNVGILCETGTLPGRPPQDLQDDRNWLTVGPKYKKRGIIFDIEESYWLSVAGGWCAPIYNGKGTLSTAGVPGAPGLGGMGGPGTSSGSPLFGGDVFTGQF